jgi:dihydrolipoamide dehydrogenase
MDKYDVLVIGGGPAGYYCSRECARGGKKTALVEIEALGGTGFRWGCLPVKRRADDIKKLLDLGGGLQFCRTSNSYSLIAADHRDEMSRLESKIYRDLREFGVEVLYGEGKLKNKHQYEVKGRIIEAENIVIATGTYPFLSSDIEVDGKMILSHKELLELKEPPRSIIIIGGNVEGCEFASILSIMGISVTIIEMEEEILKGNDRDLVDPLNKLLVSSEVKLHLGSKVEEVKKTSNKASVKLSTGEIIDAEKILVTGGRKPNFPLGVQEIGVKILKDRIPVDKNLKTNLPHIYAIGDINGILGMSHIAIQQGILAAENILSGKEVTMNYASLPRAIFTLPEIAGAGVQEWELRESGISYKKGVCELSNTWRGFSKRISEGFVKVLAAKDDTVLGIWIVGNDAADLVGMLGFVIDSEVKLEDIKRQLLVHPSLSEALLEAVLNIQEQELGK